jgi:outer membrane lipoprotein-sorting protein
MKKIATYGISAILALAFVAVSATVNSANAQNAGLISSILNKMERNRRDLKSLRADIVMDKFDNGLKLWDGKQYGSIKMIPSTGRSANVRVDWTRPLQETLSVVDGKYTLYRPNQNMAWVGLRAPSNTPGSVFALMNMSGSQARANYVIGLDKDSTNSISHLIITPKSGSDFKVAEIWVDASGMVVQAKVISRNEDAQMVWLTNVQKNATVSVNDLKVDLPGRTKIVKT